MIVKVDTSFNLSNLLRVLNSYFLVLIVISAACLQEEGILLISYSFFYNLYTYELIIIQQKKKIRMSQFFSLTIFFYYYFKQPVPVRDYPHAPAVLAVGSRAGVACSRPQRRQLFRPTRQFRLPSPPPARAYPGCTRRAAGSGRCTTCLRIIYL